LYDFAWEVCGKIPYRMMRIAIPSAREREDKQGKKEIRGNDEGGIGYFC
jgi:hypothetical protein